MTTTEIYDRATKSAIDAAWARRDLADVEVAASAAREAAHAAVAPTCDANTAYHDARAASVESCDPADVTRTNDASAAWCAACDTLAAREASARRRGVDLDAARDRVAAAEVAAARAADTYAQHLAEPDAPPRVAMSWRDGSPQFDPYID